MAPVAPLVSAGASSINAFSKVTFVPHSPTGMVGSPSPHRGFAWVGVCSLVLITSLAVGCRPTTVTDPKIEQGVELMQARQFAEAIPVLESALDSVASAEVRSRLQTAIGNCYNELDQLDKALEFHDLALESDPDNFQAMVNKGIVYRLQGNYEDAAAMYTRALEVAPEYAELHASMGALALHRADYQGAVIHLERSLELDPSMPVGHSNLALAYAMVGRFADAETSLQRATELGYHQPERIREEIDRLKEDREASASEGAADQAPGDTPAGDTEG